MVDLENGSLSPLVKAGGIQQNNWFKQQNLFFSFLVLYAENSNIKALMELVRTYFMFVKGHF
jgi:hypothetical protein